MKQTLIPQSISALYKNSQTTALNTLKEKSKSNALDSVKAGSVVSLTLVDKTKGKVTLRLDDETTFEADASKVVGNVGETLNFEVLKSGNGGVSLRQINSQQEKGQDQGAGQVQSVDGLSTQSVKELFEKSGFSKEINIFSKEYSEEQAKVAEALAKIKQKIMYAQNNVSANAVSQLTSAGISLDKIDLDLLTSTIREIKSQPTIEQTKKSLDAVHSKLNDIKGLNDKTIVKLLRDESPLTLENIYVAKHSVKGDYNGEAKKLSSSDWSKLSQEISKLFETEGIEKSPENLKLAKLMVENDVAVTKENIDKALFLKHLKNNIDDALVISEAVKNIVASGSVGTIPLYNMYNSANSQDEAASELSDDIVAVLKALPKLNDRHIDQLVRSQLPITLKNLKEVLNNSLNVGGNKQEQKTSEKIDAITAKRQLMEIQLKMTEESAVRLSQKGISIDTEPLKKVLDELRKLEQESYAKNLRMVGASDSPENVKQMNNLFSMIREISPLTNNVFSYALQHKNELNIEGVHNAVKTAQLFKDLETFATVPSTRFNDSFAKIKDQFKPLVEELGLNATEQNVRAAAILSKNEMDVTEENIISVKTVDAKITEVRNRLHPNIAASIIKDGLNPAKLHVDDVIKYIDDFSAKYADDLSDKIPELVAEMDRDKQLTDDQRDSMIAIYRMLNTISQNGSAALGVVVKNDIDLTLGNMLSASKYFKETSGKKSKLDYTVDENFGSLEQIVRDESNIAAAFEKTEQVKAYHTLVAKQLAENCTVSALKKVVSSNDNILNMPLDAVAEMVAAANEESNLVKQEEIQSEQMAQQISEKLNVSAEAVKLLQESNAPVTLANIGVMQSLMKNQFFVADSLNSLDEHELNENELNGIKAQLLDTSLDKLADGKSPNEVLDDISEQLSNIWENSKSPDLMKQIKLIQSAIKVSQFTEKPTSNSFKLPIALNGKIAGLNMYVINENVSATDDIKLAFSINTSNLSNVSAIVTVSGDNASIEVSSDNTKSLAFLKENTSVLEKFVNDAGFNLTYVSFGEADTNTNVNEESFAGQIQPQAREIELHSTYNEVV